MPVNPSDYLLKEVSVKKIFAERNLDIPIAAGVNLPTTYSFSVGGGIVKNNNKLGLIVYTLKTTSANPDTQLPFTLEIEIVGLYESKSEITENPLQEFAQTYAHKELWPYLKERVISSAKAMGININLPVDSPVKLSNPSTQQNDSRANQ
jgi:hypothetical protein